MWELEEGHNGLWLWWDEVPSTHQCCDISVLLHAGDPVPCPWGCAHTLPLCPAELSIAYASGKAISLVHVGPGAHIKQVQEWQEPLHLQDVDWQRSVLYGTDDHGTLLRVVGHPGRREAIVTGLPGETLWGDRGHPPLPDAP